ncbi:Ger(x)C family spore germination protein, partial [Thermodesulfitimonas autotrophica]|uniref:Ger(x)C family spore germination protein n=1 Tax=Thermodesulfitimonas autotrophica TaxID=1894989 RepID=UPI002FE33894
MRWLVVPVLLVLTVFTAGCWDLKEVEDLGFVTGIGVDAAPQGKVELLVQLINPRVVGGAARGAITPGASASAKCFRNYTVVGRTIFDAVRELSLIVPKRLFFAQNREVLFGEKLSREGLGKVLDFFDRSVDIRKLVYVLVVRGKMSEVMEVPNPHEICPALRIDALMREQQRANHSPPVNLGDFLGLL